MIQSFLIFKIKLVVESILQSEIVSYACKWNIISGVYFWIWKNHLVLQLPQNNEHSIFRLVPCSISSSLPVHHLAVLIPYIEWTCHNFWFIHSFILSCHHWLLAILSAWYFLDHYCFHLHCLHDALPLLTISHIALSVLQHLFVLILLFGSFWK